MRRWLLSISSAETLEALGLWLIIGGLVGEAALIILGKSPNFSLVLNQSLSTVFTLAIATGVWIEKVGADAISSEKDARIAEANARASEATLELAKIEERIAPRRLSNKQKSELVKKLEPFGSIVIFDALGFSSTPDRRLKVSVASFAIDLEAAQLGSDLLFVFKSAHLNVANRLASEIPFGSFSIGIHVSGTHDKLVLAIAEGLAEIGGFQVSASPKLPENADPDMAAAVLIGIRPIT